LTTVFTGTRTLATWAAGVDSTLIFTPQAIVNTAGQYYWEVTAANTADMNAGNNITSTEIGMVDLSGPTAQLSYISGTTSTYSWGWNGGGPDDGLGIYMNPPVHPASINSIQVFITTATSSGYIVSLFDDNGLNGGPGTVLFTDTIPFSSVVTNSWNTVTLPVPVSIPSGGFYVAAMMGGPDLFFGTEDVGPMSRRNYEVLGGAWSTFRDNNLREAMIRVTIGSYPCAILSGFNYTANNNTVNFSNQSTGGTTYVWDFGDGNTSTSLSPTHTYSALGTYTVCLIATNSCGSDTICQPVTIACPLPNAGFSSQANGITVAFTDTSSAGATSWLWDFGDGNTSTQQNPSHTYASTGTFNVCLIASNACGADTTCGTVTICSQLSIGFNFSDNNGTVTFNNVSSGATFFIWDFGDGNSSTQQNPTNTYANPGTYTVCLVISNVCYSDTLCQTLTVCPTPAAAYSFNANQGTVSFTDLTPGTITSWAWDFGDGNTSTQQNPTHTYTSSGVYTACLIATNSCGSDTSCQAVNVTVIGIADPLQAQVEIYPVPATDHLTAKVHLPGQMGDYFEAQVMDASGKIIWNAPLYGQGTDWTLEIDTKDFAQGLYLLQIKGADFRLTKKFVKE
jgi:PKD repeat protein